MSIVFRANPSGLLHHVRDQRHKTSAFDCEREVALFGRGEAETLRRIDLPLGVEEAAEKVGVFIIETAELLPRVLVESHSDSQ